MNETTARANVANSLRDMRQACRNYASAPANELEHAFDDLMRFAGMVNDNRNNLRAILSAKPKEPTA